VPAVSGTIFRCVTLVSFALMACRATAPSLQSARVVTVCKLAADPGKFAGEMITVVALVTSDGLHSTSLRDKACDGAGIALKIDPKLEARADVIAMRQAIFAGVPGTQGKKITGSFTGRFEWHRHGRPSYVLVAEEAKDLQAQF